MDISDVYALQSFRATDSEGHDTYFRELFIFRGGVEIGNPQTGGVLDEYSNYYFIHVQESDLSIHYWQKVDGVWGEVDPDLLPDLTQAQEGDRRFSAALDQNQRIIVSFERAGSIKVTRWTGSEYEQDISFSGINPAIFAEGLAARYIPGSDVIIFYQKPADMSKIYTRLSSENYSTEREYIDYSEDIILDKVIYNRNDPYRFQLLIADANGEKFYLDDELQGLRSQLYPIRITMPEIAYTWEFEQFIFNDVVYLYYPYFAVDINWNFYSLILDTVVNQYFSYFAQTNIWEFDSLTFDPVVVFYYPYLVSDWAWSFEELFLVTVAYLYAPYMASDYTWEFSEIFFRTA